MYRDEKQMGVDLNLVFTSSQGDSEDLSKPTREVDAVFGELNEDGPNYKDVGWMGTVVLMMKTQIGLGVLGIPSALDVLGMIPGVIVLVVIAAMTTWCGWEVGQFKIRHPEVYGIDDAGAIMGGRLGREILYWGFNIYFIFLAASAMLGISIGLNALSSHAACTAIFVVVAAFIGFTCGSIQTLGKVTWVAWVGVFGILSAVLTLTIAVGLQERPAKAPQGGVFQSDYELFGSPTFAEALSAVSTIVFAFAGAPAFFSIVSEMRNTRDFTKSLVIAQSGVGLVYLVIGVIVYYFCGSYVASPALGSAGVMMKKVCYGLALPGLVASCMLFVHLPAKSFFVRFMRGTKHLTSNSTIHWLAWLGSTGGVTVAGYLIGSGIPVFDELISLVGALLATFMSIQPMAIMWLFDNWSRPDRNGGWKLGVAWSIITLIVGTFILIGGTYGSILGIINSTERTAPWSCADNSHSAAL